MDFYFSRFEARRPPAPLKTPIMIKSLWQVLAVVALVLGANYIRWRWMESLNMDALWYSIPLVVAETLAWIGTILFTINLWHEDAPDILPPPTDINQCLFQANAIESRPVSVDLFITTYSEDEELVRLSIRDTLKITYPDAIDYRVHVLDDGRRLTMRAVCQQEGVNYITRDNNLGFKAGNLRNGLEQTMGDFIVICDADTRVFPTLLQHTLGYFRDPDMAWVQTPQWFYDIPEGKPLRHWLKVKASWPGFACGWLVERIFGPIQIGRDPFFNDPRMFYDVIQRRRNWANAAFCCGAASIHRREAVMQAALRSYVWNVEHEIHKHTRDIKDPQLSESLSSAMRLHVLNDIELTPYKFHVSEDIYTSLVLHGDSERRWRSLLHPYVESKMLSPQDILTWMIQRFKYAAGSIDILLHDNIFNRKKFRLSGPQILMYGTTFWSYLACLWNTVFLISPLIYLFTGISPLSSYSTPFYYHFLPFFLMSELAFMFGTWGISAWDGRASYLSFFAINLRALGTVLRGEQVKFHVTPKERQSGNFIYLIKPQIAIVILTLLGLIWGGIQIARGNIDDPSGYVINIFWGTINMLAMMPMILAAFWQPESYAEKEEAVR